jgi:hypothetical protein
VAERLRLQGQSGQDPPAEAAHEDADVRIAQSEQLSRRPRAHRAGRSPDRQFQGDAHIFRNARSIIEEYYLNSASPRRKDVLFQAWAHYRSFYKKRTLSTECYELYHQHFGGTATSARRD